MVLTDIFTRGFIAGLAGGVVQLVWGLVSKFVIQFTDLLYGEFAAKLVFGRPASSLADHIFSQFAVFIFYGLCGIIFVYLIPYITSQNLYLKGSLWGGFISFFSYIITLLFKVPGLTAMKLNTAISQLIGGLVWGVSLVIALN